MEISAYFFNKFFSQAKQAREVAAKTFVPDYLLKEVIHACTSNPQFATDRAKLKVFAVVVRLLEFNTDSAKACIASMSLNMEELYRALGHSREEIEVSFPAHDFSCAILREYSQIFRMRHQEIEKAIRKHAKRAVAA